MKENSCFAASYISQIHTQFSRPSGGGFRKLALVSLARLSVTKFAKHFLIAFYLHNFFSSVSVGPSDLDCPKWLHEMELYRASFW